jgi:two-component system, response regulator PdtaR
MNPKKILIVEDDKMLCTIFEMFIKELGHEFLGLAQKGYDAIDMCKNEPPDVILMDIHLAGEIDGIETAKIIHEKFDIPVVYISSDIEESTVQSATYINTYGFLVKPVYKSTLGIAIEFAYSKHKFDKKLAEQKK